MLSRLSIAILLTTTLSALDTINVTTINQANEQSLVAGIVQFSRTGVSAALTVSYTLTGTATFGVDFSAPVAAGTVSFAIGQATALLTITPLDNGSAGATYVRVNVSASALYTVGASGTTQVVISDTDAASTISTPIPVAYKTPAVLSSGYPLEVLGRSQWTVAMSDPGAVPFRGVSVLIAGDSIVGPTAVLGTDYLMGWNTSDFMTTVVTTTVQPVTIATPGTAPGPTATTIGVASTASFGAGDLIFFETPSNINNGIYTITAITPATATTNPSFTITPALRTTQTTYGVTTVRRIGSSIAAGTSRFDLYGNISIIHYWAFPIIVSHTPTGRKSINLSLVQSADYRSQSPASATVILADDASVASLALSANAGQPSTSGSATVNLSTAFASAAISVPFSVSSVGATFGTDYTIAGVDSSTMIGSVTIAAGATTGTITITPLGSALVAPGTVTITLLTSYDFLLAPSSTSSSNPTAQVTVAPALRTTALELVYLAVTRLQNGFEGNLTTPLSDPKFTISLTNATGTALVGTLTSDLTCSYSLSGSTAVAGTNYTTPSGSVVITAGTSSAIVDILALNDGVVVSNPTIQMTLSSGTGYQISSVGTATAVITDSSPSFSIAAATAPSEGTTTAAYTVTNANPVNQALTVQLTVGGTATSGTDYTALATTLIFPANATTQTIAVAALTDTVDDPNETVILTIAADSASPATYTVSSVTPSATATITDSSSSSSAAVVARPNPSGGSSASGCGAGGLAAILLGLALGLVTQRRRRDN